MCVKRWVIRACAVPEPVRGHKALAEPRLGGVCRCSWRERPFWHGGGWEEKKNSLSAVARRGTCVCPSASYWGRLPGPAGLADGEGRSRSNRSLRFTLKQARDRVLGVPILQKRLFQANAGKGSCAVGCWGGWVGREGWTGWRQWGKRRSWENSME